MKKRKLLPADEALIDNFSTKYINDSFSQVASTQKALEQKKRAKIEWSLDLLPNTDIEELVLSLVRFSEPALPLSESSSKRRMLSSVVTNVRALEESKLTKQTAFGSSLVAISEAHVESHDVPGDIDCQLEWTKDSKVIIL
jgi:hypothetical protein